MTGLRRRLTRAWDALRSDPYDARWLHKRSAMTRALNRAGFAVVRGDMVWQDPEVRRWLARDDQQQDVELRPRPTPIFGAAPGSPEWLGKLTWTCHVCDALRPDDKISVASATFPIGRGVDASGTVNQRYCNDRPACAYNAQVMADELARRLARAGDPTIT